MTELGALNREVAKQLPERAFETPLAIVNEVLLTKGEKLATLERWRLSIVSELDASNEGMAEQGYAGKQLKALETIEEAKSRLHNSVESEMPN
jgi:hypothetical protein